MGRSGCSLLKLMAVCCAAALLLTCLSSCGRRGQRPATPDEPTPPEPITSSVEKVAYLTFSLPERIQWEQNEDEKLQNAGIAEFLVKGYTSKNTPARVIYQQLVPAETKAALRSQVLKPLENCPDSAVSEFRGTSRYRDQLNLEAICSRLGQNGPYGLISYVSIFSDSESNHLVVSEVRTPPTTKAGEFNFKNAEQQKEAANRQAIAELLRKTMEGIRACDEQKNCQ